MMNEAEMEAPVAALSWMYGDESEAVAGRFQY